MLLETELLEYIRNTERIYQFWTDIAKSLYDERDYINWTDEDVNSWVNIIADHFIVYAINEYSAYSGKDVTLSRDSRISVAKELFDKDLAEYAENRKQEK